MIFLKKAVSVILSAIMILSLCVPVFAQTADRDLPVIYLHGLSNCVIYDADGNNAVADVELEDVLKNKELMGPIMSGFVYGLATDDWQPYCDAFRHSGGTMTVFDNEEYPQFMLYNDDTQALSPVTDHDSCDDRYEGTNFLEAFFKFIKNLFRLIKNLFDKIGK